MAFALHFNSSPNPLPHLPIAKIDLGPVSVARIKRFLFDGQVPLEEGPCADGHESIPKLLQRLGISSNEDAFQAFLPLLFFLSPSNIGSSSCIGNTSFRDANNVGSQFVIFDYEHIHSTRNSLDSGEIIHHSQSENTLNQLVIAATEELMLVMASIMRSFGFIAQLGLTKELNKITTVLCVLDEDRKQLLSIGVPLYPRGKELIIFNDRETAGIVKLLNAFNLAKRIASAPHIPDALEYLEHYMEELRKGKEAVTHPLANVIENIRSPHLSLKSGSS